MSRTLKQLAEEVMQVQNACNISGVARAFAAAMADLGEHCSGTTERNQHAITALWISKLSSLNDYKSEQKLAECMDEVSKLAGSEWETQ